MNKKNDIDVVINGREYTLSGYESGEYLQKIAAHINGKYDEFKLRDGYNRLDMDMKNIFLAINLSDEYFKAQKAADELKLENEEMEKEIFDMKHEMITMKSQLEKFENDIKQLEEEKRNAENDVIRLETELGKKEDTSSDNNQSYNKKHK